MAATAQRTKKGKTTRLREEEDEAPVLAGRLVIAAVLLAAMVLFPMSKLGDWIEPRTDKQKSGSDNTGWAVGKTARVQITLVTSDYNTLLCASQETFEGKHCAYKAEGEPWPRQPGAPIDDNKRDIIQPYRTWPNNQLIMVAGLWADPAVALRLQREPAAGVASKRLSRFVADCEMRFIGQMKAPKLRWPNGSQWLNEGDSLLGQPVSCKITTTDE